MPDGLEERGPRATGGASAAHAVHLVLEARCAESAARAGRLVTPHGSAATPLFMPVGTRGTVRGLLPGELRRTGAEMLLANAFHLALRPGEGTVAALGGLHRLMGWDGPTLTDSGGYQVFSLAHLTTVDEDGATVKSPVDGTPIRLTPERVLEIQHRLGPDVAMAFDHCAADPLDRDDVGPATDRTHRWLERCVRAWEEQGGRSGDQALFGIVQGGGFEDLRRASVEAVTAHDLPGYAIGGVSVGEDRETMLRAVSVATPLLPEDRPRYLMGVGTPLDLYEAVERGVDMFDCVTPTRHGRTHQAFTGTGRVNLRNRIWREDTTPLDPDCDCATCRDFTRGALRHLCKSGEMLGGILISLHNLAFFQRLMAEMRTAIRCGGFVALRERFVRAQRRIGE